MEQLPYSTLVPGEVAHTERPMSVRNRCVIEVLWVYYTIPFGFSLFGHFLGITLKF